jgi:hypothetical protein
MHAVVVDVSVNDRESAERELRESVVPRVSQAPGFVSAFWLAPVEGKGHSIAVFESEDAANGMAEMVRGNAPSQVTVEKVEVREVVANA